MQTSKTGNEYRVPNTIYFLCFEFLLSHSISSFLLSIFLFFLILKPNWIHAWLFKVTSFNERIYRSHIRTAFVLLPAIYNYWMTNVWVLFSLYKCIRIFQFRFIYGFLFFFFFQFIFYSRTHTWSESVEGMKILVDICTPKKSVRNFTFSLYLSIHQHVFLLLSWKEISEISFKLKIKAKKVLKSDYKSTICAFNKK